MPKAPPMSESNPRERMKQAIHQFEKIQQDSNIQWLKRQVNLCKGLDSHTNSLDKRRDELAKGPKHTFWSWRASHLAILEQRKETLAKNLKFESWTALASHHDLATVDEILSVDVGQYDKGTYPPASADQASVFLEQLHKAINEDFDHDAPEFQLIDLPEDYGLLLKFTDGLHDTDLRNSGVCGIAGVRDANIAKMTGYSEYNITRGLYNVDNVGWGGELWRYGWDISTGFSLGGDNHHGDQNWLAYYYCARTLDTREELPPYPNYPDMVTENEKEWKWRIFYKEPERWQHSFHKCIVFNDLVEWLGFYQDWWDRESVQYPAWEARMLASVELQCGRPDRGEDEQNDEEQEDEDVWEETDLDVGIVFETS